MKNLNYKTIGAFLVGALIATVAVGYMARKQADLMRLKYRPVSHTEAVNWMIDNPEYAKLLKENHDQYLKAAEETFLESLQVSGNE